MSNLPDDIVKLIEIDKSLGMSPNWDDQSDPRYTVFTVPLTCGLVTVGGFKLRVKVSKRWVNKDALMQLEFSAAGKRSTVNLWRLDWKPIHVHTNSGVPPSGPFDTFTDSHQHPFAENFIASETRMRTGNLPAVTPFPNNPNTLSDFLVLGGKLFRINDIYRIVLPSTGTDLFWQDAE